MPRHKKKREPEPEIEIQEQEPVAPEPEPEVAEEAKPEPEPLTESELRVYAGKVAGQITRIANQATSDAEAAFRLRNSVGGGYAKEKEVQAAVDALKQKYEIQ